MWHQVVDDYVRITAVAFSPPMDKTHIFLGDEQGAVYASTDYGDIWQQQFRLPKGDAITCIAISPNFSSDATIFFGTQKSGVIKKVAAGGPYNVVSHGLFAPTVQAFEYITSIAVSSHYRTDFTVFVSPWHAGVFRSDDGGEMWTKYSTGLTSNSQADRPSFKSPHFSEVRISKNFPQDRTIFVACYDGLFKSTDAGNLWLAVETLSVRIIMSLAIAPWSQDRSIMAMTTLLGGAYLSEDQGTTWGKINQGLSDVHLLDIAFSPNLPSDGAIFTISNTSFYRTTIQQKSWEQTKLGYWLLWMEKITKRRIEKNRLSQNAPFTRFGEETAFSYGNSGFAGFWL
jgi:hypothetical protein